MDDLVLHHQTLNPHIIGFRFNEDRVPSSTKAKALRFTEHTMGDFAFAAPGE